MKTETSPPIPVSARRHEACCILANKRLTELPEATIVSFCPDDYGPTVTDAHLQYLWDRLYEDFAGLSEEELWEEQYVRGFAVPSLSVSTH